MRKNYLHLNSEDNTYSTYYSQSIKVSKELEDSRG